MKKLATFFCWFIKMDEEFLNINLNNATMHPNNHALYFAQTILKSNKLNSL